VREAPVDETIADDSDPSPAAADQPGPEVGDAGE
jgi:hypothetical protein